LILVETGPNSSKDMYANKIDYDYNSIDTIFMSIYIGDVDPRVLGPEFPSLYDLEPYYEEIHSPEFLSSSWTFKLLRKVSVAKHKKLFLD
jgi:hypothetical protein